MKPSSESIFFCQRSAASSLDGRPGRRSRLVEERHRIVAQVDELDVDFRALAGKRMNPIRRMIGETSRTRTADNDSNLWLCHELTPFAAVV